METIKDIIQLISDNRGWLLSIVLVGTLALLAIEVRGIFKDMLEEMEE